MKTQTTVTTKAQTKAQTKAAPKAAQKSAQKTLAKGVVLVDQAALKFFRAIAGAYHKDRLSVSDDGRITATPEGRVFFKSRLATSKMAAQAWQAMIDNASLAGGKVGSRAWIANAAVINGKPVALPAFAGAGDTAQQAAVAHLIANA